MGKKNKGKKGRSLTGLAAALVNSGHLSENKAKKLTREKRRDDKALGRDAVAGREAQEAVAAAGKRTAEAMADRERELARVGVEARERARRVVRENLVSTAGNRRWFFGARDGRILFVDVGDDVAGMLVSGGAGVVETLGEARDAHGVVGSPKALQTLVGIEAGLVRFWNRDGPPPRSP